MNVFHLLLLITALHFTSCISMDLCQGENQCLLCTMTGPTIIDVHGQVNSIQDRCTYTVMTTPSVPGVQVLATFQERRRTDVSFLDRVTLRLEGSGVHIYLEQGGRVQVNNVQVRLNATAQLVHGLELTRDLGGVTAKTSRSNHTMIIFFDGYTAQIHIKGPSGQTPSVDGLCGNSNRSFSELRPDGYSSADCETQFEEMTNSTINCTDVTQRCNLVLGASFATCHSHVNPEPYAAACINTLCKYPAVDGLNCQFLEAYARVCGLYSYNTTDGWRANASCSEEPRAFCQDRFCSSHEFCGDSSVDGETRCHCRAIFASKYRSQNTLSDGVVCNDTSRSISLFVCLLEDKGISYSDLQLYDRTCRGQLDNVTHTVTLEFDPKTDPCGTMMRVNDNGEMINKNAVILESTKAELVDMTCPFILPDINIDFSVAIEILSSKTSSSVQYITTGVWNYTLTMAAYTDEARTKLVDTNTELRLNQKVWFELKTDGLDENVVALVTHSCFTTDQPSENSNLRYELIIDGCANPTDETVNVQNNGQGTSNYFSFNLFQFRGRKGNIYLHCKLNLCFKQSNTCIPNCSVTSRRRRSVPSQHEEENVTVMMAWRT